MTVLLVLDAAGRRRSPATLPGCHEPRLPRPAGRARNCPPAAAVTATPSRRRSSSRGSRAQGTPDLAGEFETLDQARAAIGAYIDRYHHRPHQFLGYRTPKEVRQTWEDAQETKAL